MKKNTCLTQSLLFCCFSLPIQFFSSIGLLIQFVRQKISCFLHFTNSEMEAQRFKKATQFYIRSQGEDTREMWVSWQPLPAWSGQVMLQHVPSGITVLTSPDWCELEHETLLRNYIDYFHCMCSCFLGYCQGFLASAEKGEFAKTKWWWCSVASLRGTWIQLDHWGFVWP